MRNLPKSDGNTPTYRQSEPSPAFSAPHHPSDQSDPTDPTDLFRPALLRINDVPMTVNSVTLDGTDNLFSIGALISGTGSSEGVIENSTIRRLQFDIQAVDSAINIHDNLFEGIREDAVFVRLPDLAKGAASTPVLGVADNPETGFNQFTSVAASSSSTSRQPPPRPK